MAGEQVQDRGVRERAHECGAVIADHLCSLPGMAVRIRAEVTAPGVPEGMSASFVSAGFDRELQERLNGLVAAMSMPVLFLQGALDPGQQPHEYETVTNEVADGHLQFVQAGHFLHLESPAAVTDAIAAFLAREDRTP